MDFVDRAGHLVFSYPAPSINASSSHPPRTEVARTLVPHDHHQTRDDYHPTPRSYAHWISQNRQELDQDALPTACGGFLNVGPSTRRPHGRLGTPKEHFGVDLIKMSTFCAGQ